MNVLGSNFSDDDGRRPAQPAAIAPAETAACETATGPASAVRPTAALFGPLGLRRVFWLVLLFHSAMFFQGCDGKRFVFTTGPVVPFATVAVDDGDWFPSELLEFNGVACALNCALVLAVLWLIARRLPRVSRCLATRRFLAIVVLCFLVFNSILIWPPLWMNLVWMPTAILYDAVEFFVGEMDKATNRLAVDAISRFYFFLCQAVCYGVVSLAIIVHRKYVRVSPERWWQFNLRGLVAAMVILGAGIGLAIRLAMR